MNEHESHRAAGPQALPDSCCWVPAARRPEAAAHLAHPLAKARPRQWGSGPDAWLLGLMEKSICLAGCGAGRSRVGTGLGPGRATRARALTSLPTRRASVKRHQLICVSIPQAEYAENKSKKRFWSLFFIQ